MPLGHDPPWYKAVVRFLLLLIFIPPLLLGSAGIAYTSAKLHKMKQIRGWEPGAEFRSVRVLEKANEPPTPNGLSASWWVRWSDENSIHVPGRHRLNLPYEVWAQLNLGDPIEITFFPDGSGPYHRDGIFADDGNILFDRSLLAIEWAMVVGSFASAVLLSWALRRRRGKTATVVHEPPPKTGT